MHASAIIVAHLPRRVSFPNFAALGSQRELLQEHQLIRKDVRKDGAFTPEFGVIRRLNPREDCSRKGADFTSWLATNLSELSAGLGMEPQLVQRITRAKLQRARAAYARPLPGGFSALDSPHMRLHGQVEKRYVHGRNRRPSRRM